MSIKIFQLHKRSSISFEYIQDKVAFSKVNAALAISDGTTQSFNSQDWALLITKKFADHPMFEATGLIRMLKNCVSDYNQAQFTFSENPAKASLERTKKRTGGTATFLGVQLTDDKKLKIISCGDSNCAVLKQNGEIEFFPYNEINKLDANKDFINTNKLLEDELDLSSFVTKVFDFNIHDTYVFTTDAISRLILKDNTIINKLINIEDFDGLLNFCENQWQKKQLEEDDITIVIIEGDLKDEETISPPLDFSFEEAQLPDFKPTTFTQTPSQNFKKEQMQYLNEQITGIANDFRILKRKQNTHSFLLLFILLLLLGAILIMLDQNPDNYNKDKTELNNSNIKPFKIKKENQLNDTNKITDKLKRH